MKRLIDTALGLISTTRIISLTARALMYMFTRMAERKGKQLGYFVTALNDQLQRELDSRNNIDAV